MLLHASDLLDCFYCKKHGHIKFQYWKLLSKRKEKAYITTVALMAIVGHEKNGYGFQHQRVVGLEQWN